MGCARAGAAATDAPGPSASTPSASPAPTASSAPHPGCLQRSASAGASGAGGGVGRGRLRRPGSQSPTAENEWIGASRGRTGLGPRTPGCLQLPSDPLTNPVGRPPSVAVPSFLPGGAARRGRELGRKESGKGGVGGRKAKAGGRRGRKRPPCARAGPRRVAARVAGPCNLGPPPGAARDERDRSCPRGGPFPREVLGSR